MNEAFVLASFVVDDSRNIERDHSSRICYVSNINVENQAVMLT